jgi:aryl-alcohol dehydrogenase-like predicted oxidoreductase
MKYRIFGRSGLRVSELCLGTMTFGTEWGWGSDKEQSAAVFEEYAKAGGNFLDTANRYTEGTSERFLAEFIASDRDHFVVATKYSLHDRVGDPNFAGNHRKNLHRSLRASLERLGTDYVDLLWVHAWDFLTAPEEMMRSLDDVVRSGRVLHIAVSDTPAWIVSQANTIAELRGWEPFTGLQVEYSLIERTPERDLLPMAKAFGLAVTPWSPLAGGALTGKYLQGEQGRIADTSPRRGERAARIAAEVVAQARELGVPAAAVALRWTMQQPFTSIPIVGARTAEQLRQSLQAADLELPAQSMQALDAASAIEKGFPHDFLEQTHVQNLLFAHSQDSIVR